MADILLPLRRNTEAVFCFYRYVASVLVIVYAIIGSGGGLVL